MERIYCDHNATTPLAPEALEAMGPWLEERHGNASSVHQFGREARYAVEKARRQVARLLGAADEEIFFTSGGTESDNLAIQGIALARRDAGRHLVTTAIEHPAVLGACEALADFGFETTRAMPDNSGVVAMEEVAASLRPDTVLVSVMAANSETGVLQPVADIASLCHDRGVLFHTDAVQALGRIPFSPLASGADLVSVSAHKFHGPKGIGALWVRQGVELRPLMRGGHHESGLRPGTENVPAIAGFGAAAELAMKSIEEEGRRLASLRDTLQSRIEETFGDDVLVIGREAQRLPGTLNLCFRGLKGTFLVEELDARGIAVSTGSACSSGKTGPSHVLKSMDVPGDFIDGCIRISLGRGNSVADVEKICQAIRDSVGALADA